MNVALRLLMRKPAATGPQDRMVRVKNYASPSNSGSATVTFDEGTALDSTHLLVAIVHYTSAGRTLTASGWTTGATGSGESTTAAIYARQGDGSLNSITVTASISTQRFFITLLAFSGYSSATALNSNSGTFTAVTTASPVPSSTPSGYGVCVTGMRLVAAASDPTWNDGYTLNGTTQNLGSPFGRQSTARKEYTGSGGSYAPAPTWSSATNGLWLHGIYSLTP